MPIFRYFVSKRFLMPTSASAAELYLEEIVKAMDAASSNVGNAFVVGQTSISKPSEVAL
jgi:hypothetical protein